MAKGLLLDVYRNASGGNFTNGPSQHAAHVIVTGMRMGHSEVRDLPLTSQVFSLSETAPEVVLVVRQNGSRLWLHLEPAEGCPEGHVGFMHGGNYAGTSDSRWGELTGGADLLAIHDRSETPAQYRALSY